MSLAVEIATPADDAAIRALLRRQAIPGPVTVTFEREPSFFAGLPIAGADPLVLVARDDTGDIVGLACRTEREVYVNGEPTRLRYLGQLRIDDACRGRWLLARGFAALAGVDRTDGAPPYLLSIADGSRQATGVLVERPRRSFPRVRHVAEYCTLALRVARRWPRPAPVDSTVEIRTASAEDRAGIVACLAQYGAERQFATVWTERTLAALEPLGLRPDCIVVATRRGAIVGVMGAWDQSAVKQTVVRGYRGWLRVASWLGPRLAPPVGAHVRSAYLTLLAVADGDVGLFDGMLRGLAQRTRAAGAEYLIAGFDTRDPWLARLRGVPAVAYGSRLYLASWPNGAPLHARLDGRPAYVDVGTL